MNNSNRPTAELSHNVLIHLHSIGLANLSRGRICHIEARRRLGRQITGRQWLSQITWFRLNSFTIGAQGLLIAREI